MGVREFTRAESVALLRTLAPELSEADADRVAAAVGDLPLAVDQAGSLLARRRPRRRAPTCGCCASGRPSCWPTDRRRAYPVSVAASWAVAFDRLAADDPAALDLLTLVAWCGPEPVPLTLLTDHPDQLPDRLAATVARSARAGPVHQAAAPARRWPP